MKKLTVVLLCLAILFSMVPVAYAQDATNEMTNIEDFEEYVISIIPDLQKLPDVQLSEDALYLSQAIEILDDNDDVSYVFFLFEEDSCVGEITVVCIDGEFYSSFVYNDFPAITEVYNDQKMLWLVAYDESLIMFSESEATEILGNVSENCQNSEIIQYCNDKANNTQGYVLELTLVESTDYGIALAADPPYSGLPYSSHTLDVPYVGNTSVNGVGICWAAATASIVRYLRPAFAASAWVVYNNVLREKGSASGNIASVLCGLAYYDVEGYIGVESSISLASLTDQIDNGYPAYLSIVGNDGTENYYHAVVACGYCCESDGTDYLQILDSNVINGKIWISINRNTNAIVYRAGSVIYTVWRRTIYASGMS